MEENESQKVLQVYPGFWSCVTVGTNHTPLQPLQVFAVVTASSLQYQVLPTSLHLGATIQAVDDALQSNQPQARFGLEPNGAPVSKVAEVTLVALNVIVAEEGQIVCAIPTNWFRVLIVLLGFYRGTKYKVQ